MRAPATAEMGLQQMLTLAEKWLKFYETVWGQGDEAVLNRLHGTSLSPDLLRLVQETRDFVQQVGTAAAEIEKALERKTRQSRKG
jgi:hypothetical protein